VSSDDSEGAAHRDARRVVGYVRVSTDEQLRGFGPAVQRERIAEYAKREKLRLVATYEDSISGTVPLAGRPGLSEALDVVRAGRAEALLVARQDRIARDSLVAALVERDFEEAGGSVVSAEGGNGNGPAEKLARTVMDAVAEYDRSSLVARLAAARARKAAEGGYAGGRPPFGYTPTGGALAPHPTEADVVRSIFDLAAEGYSVRQIASLLNRAGTLERNWRPGEVHRILVREDYRRGTGTARIVDPRVWNRAAVQLASRRRR
jgi:DNA invertase Pin-like site-specific DNA recombinase